VKKVLFIEAVKYGSYYEERYDHIASLGYEVYVLQGIGEKPISDKFEFFTAGSKKISDLVEAAKKWQETVKFDGITTLAEPSVIATAYIAEALGLQYTSSDAVKNSRNKLLMRQCHATASCAHPKFLGINNIEDTNKWPLDSYPAIVKPTMGAASSFVFKVETPQELEKYASIVIENSTKMEVSKLEASNDKVTSIPTPAIVEAYLPGSEHLVEGYVFDGVFMIGSIVDRITIESNTFDDDVHASPTCLTTSQVDAIQNEIQLAVQSQGIWRSAVHAEIRFDGCTIEATPNIVEIAIRPGGGGLNHMASLCYNYDPLDVICKIAIGESPDYQYSGPTGDHSLAACIMGDEGKIKSISGTKEIIGNDNVLFFKLIASVGDELLRPPKGNSIVGFMGVTAKNRQEALSRLEGNSSKLIIEVK